MYDSIKRTQSLPLDELNNEYFDRQIPVIIEGIVNKWPAAKWTPEYLAETLGYKIVPVVVMCNGDYANSTITNMPLKDYLNLIGAINSYQIEERSDPEKTYYLAQASLSKYLPELLEELVTPSFFPHEKLRNAVIYVGGSLFSQLHYHPRGSATLCVIYGQKKVRLFAPDQTPYLYKYSGNSKLHNMSKTQEKHPDPIKFPKFSQARFQEITVSAGEMLYIPMYCWHSIENEGYSIAVVFFWSTSLKSRFLPPPGMRTSYFFETIATPLYPAKRVIKKIGRRLAWR